MFESGIKLEEDFITMPAIHKIISEDKTESLLTIYEGKFHQVKRMFEAAGNEVVYLKRISMGPLELDKSLPEGKCRPLTEEEIEKLKKQAVPEDQPAMETEVCTVEIKVLKKGAKGDTVRAMQTLLIGYGYKMESGGKTYGADGSFGGATDKALRAYQKDQGMGADGICGPKTWAALLGV